jgi:glycosyltransferase involved in cell wall biosynthesis
MRILHVIPGLTHERGGPSAVVQALVRHQASAGHAVTVLTTDQGARHGERRCDVGEAEVERLAVRGPDRLAYAPAFAGAVRARLRTADVVHVHSVFTYPVHSALAAARSAGTPAIVRPCGHLHRYSLGRSRWRKRAYLLAWGPMLRRACMAWHYTSENEARESWPGEPGRGFVLPNGIEPNEFDADRQQARQAVATVRPQLAGGVYGLFLGRLHPKKRLDLLLEAFLAAAPREFKLVVAGPDECGLWPRLEAQFLQTPAARARIVRLDTVGGVAKVHLLAAAHWFALPSEHENFGIAALEALAAGTPVLLSPHVDLAEAAVTAGFGDAIPLTVDAWRERLAMQAADGQPSEEFVQRARNWVAENYGWSQLSARLEQHYRRVTGGVQRSTTPSFCHG